MSAVLELDEPDRQMMLLALAELALDRPGWDDAIRRLTERMNGEFMYDEFKRMNADRFRKLPWLDGTPREGAHAEGPTMEEG